MLNNIWWRITLRIFEHLIYLLIWEFVFNNNENIDFACVSHECTSIHRVNDVIGGAC